MSDKLNIKFKSQWQNFEIIENGLLVELNTSKHILKYDISFEDINKSWYIENGSIDSKTIRLYTSLFLNVFLVLCLITLLQNGPPLAFKMLSVLLLLPFLFMLKKNTETYKEKHIKSTKHLYFIYTKKNEIEVDNFIALIYKKQQEYFKRLYFKIDPVLPYNIQYERYLRLYSNNYINDNEFEIVKEDLDKYHNYDPTI